MSSNEPSLNALEQDAARNRVELMNAVDALQSRISPDAIKHNVRGYVRGKKDGLLHGLEQKALDNPLQAAAIAAGVAYPLWGIVSRVPVPLLLIAGGLALARRSVQDNDRANDPSFAQRARENIGKATDAELQSASEVSATLQSQAKAGMDSMGRAGDRLAAYADEASRAAGNAASTLSQTASDSVETARAMGSDAISAVGDTLSPASMRRAGTQANDWINETVAGNPLIAGALGLAVGAMIAAALPSTRPEDKLLGSAADDLKHKAEDVALDGIAAAKGIAAEIYQEAAGRAREEGLSADGAKKFAGQIGEKIKTTASNVAGDDQQPDRSENSPLNASGETA